MPENKISDKKISENEIKKREEKRAIIKSIRDSLFESMKYTENFDPEITLFSQAKTLDNAFRQLLSIGDDSDEMLQYYSLALKAQNQYRHTAISFNAILEANELKYNNNSRKDDDFYR